MSWRFNPFTQTLDYFKESLASDSAKRLVDTKTCAEVISALKLVVALNDDEILLAEPDTFENAKVLGVALQAGNIGDEIEVLLFGKLEDVSLTFTINDPLFLKASGSISDTAPVSPAETFNTTIGHSLGSGAIFVNIQEPIRL